MIVAISWERLTGLPQFSIFATLGLPSPSIGLTRAYWKLLHGDIAGAVRQNLMVVPVAITIGGIIIADGARILHSWRNNQ
jgi:hypothetical protein